MFFTVKYFPNLYEVNFSAEQNFELDFILIYYIFTKFFVNVFVIFVRFKNIYIVFINWNVFVLVYLFSFNHFGNNALATS